MITAGWHVTTQRFGTIPPTSPKAVTCLLPSLTIVQAALGLSSGFRLDSLVLHKWSRDACRLICVRRTSLLGPCGPIRRHSTAYDS